ncbi:polysaccharide biosynthesis/export family protein [Acuticoccus sp. I52.16.1]|uniref:polysaccharide biosynthesis/export family protein n=1 Tax=Acuticoccus sp. I52.16.1 TaxID=2928472 RepID=UPI001FD1238B|nr:polysaccharide biosynthesis/export family protein [Acuticoccus sp. I52.16.1]UOM33675.1 polysaccharide export protein [Acuticoccus sp. I52.16.1]
MMLRWIALACAAALAGCGAVPSSGPSAQVITETNRENAAPAAYVVVDVDEKVVNVTGQYKTKGFSSFYKVDFGSVQVRLAVGDQIAISIYEAGADGLFSSETSKATQIVATIDGDGEVFVPYVGTIQAAGRSSKSLRAAIEEALQDKAIQPQVQVQVANSVVNTVTILGEVGTGGKIPVPVSDFRVLDVIAAAGGSSIPTYQTRVILRRGNKVASADLEDLFDNPKENVAVQPGDTILLAAAPRSYTVYGATTTKAEIPFEARRINIAEGLAKAGGLNDLQADARGVFLFRFEPDTIAKQLSERAIVAHEGSLVPVVYRFNLKDPKSFFLMQTFELRDEDLLYVSTHPSVEFNKFLRIIEPAVSQVITALTLSERFSN